MQVFGSSCMRESLRRDEASLPYLQRRVYSLKAKGFAVKQSNSSHSGNASSHAIADAIAAKE
eukprot:4475245-Pleurochrysis_carterae.AAC.1